MSFRRRGVVLAAAKHSWAAYEAYAWPMDELMPLTNRQARPLLRWHT